MKFVLISDTHDSHRKITLPEGDVLIHAGDMTYRGEANIVADFNDWLGSLPYKHKIIIAGNHELGFGKVPLESKKQLFSNGIYLEDEALEIEGIKIYGSPWTPYFYSWEFNFPRESLAYSKSAHEAWAKIPSDTDILVTHGPAYGSLDLVNNPGQRENPHVGCKFLKERIEQLSDLKFHVFGHIHEGYGIKQSDTLTSINASVLDDQYSLMNKPIVIEI